MENNSPIRIAGLVSGTVILLIVLFLVAGVSTGFLPWRNSYAGVQSDEQVDVLAPAPTVPIGEEGEPPVSSEADPLPEETPDEDVTLEEELPTYTITVTFSRGGTAIPYGNNAVVENGEMTVTAVPDEGYAVDEMIIDGQRLTGVESYVFSDVTSDHTVHITFKRTLLDIEPDPPVFSQEGEPPVEQQWNTDI